MKEWKRIFDTSEIDKSMNGCRIRYKRGTMKFGYEYIYNRYITFDGLLGKFWITSDGSLKCIKQFDVRKWDICEVEVKVVKVRTLKPKKVKDKRSEFEKNVAEMILG